MEVLEQIDNVSKHLEILIIMLNTVIIVLTNWACDKDYFTKVSIALVCCFAMCPEGLKAIVKLVYTQVVTGMAEHDAIICAEPEIQTPWQYHCNFFDKNRM